MGRILAADFERVVIFVLDEVMARAWGQIGCEVPPEVVRDGVQDPVRNIEVSIDESLVIRHARGKQIAYRDSISGYKADHIIAKLLETQPDEPVLVLPLKRGGETLSLAIGAAPRAEKVFEKTSQYEILGEKLSDAVEIVRLRKKILAV
jgi:hypothetical protein